MCCVLLQVLAASLSLVRTLSGAGFDAAGFGAHIGSNRVDAAQQQVLLEALWSVEPGSPQVGEAATALVKLHRGETVAGLSEAASVF